LPRPVRLLGQFFLLCVRVQECLNMFIKPRTIPKIKCNYDSQKVQIIILVQQNHLPISCTGPSVTSSWKVPVIRTWRSRLYDKASTNSFLKQFHVRFISRNIHKGRAKVLLASVLRGVFEGALKGSAIMERSVSDANELRCRPNSKLSAHEESQSAV
jgi:hypothetical protein